MNIFSLLALVTAADLFPFFLAVSIASLVAFVTLLVWPRKKTNDQPQQTQTNEPKQVAEPFKPEILVGPDKQHIISGAPIDEPVEEPIQEPVAEPEMMCCLSGPTRISGLKGSATCLGSLVCVCCG